VFVAGDVALGPSVPYYLGERTRYVGIDPRRIRNLFAFRGGVFVCPAEDGRCVETGQRVAAEQPAARRIVTAARSLFGVPGPSLQYILTMAVPPDKP
jgi:hypothetical protein